ncbi:PREDICTED: uncharacterized protein LOC108369360 [Rhagoletis zephyria]|uniref:uncharacterized protein LOC108369360 n=1 Tax=Rhagoletis zephyria TaxID=28612 RepID=UPI0008116EC4|nr:PREDICTED: uncharacterized protein LOC108369360 [Rhagoletis zephyria]
MLDMVEGNENVEPDEPDVSSDLPLRSSDEIPDITEETKQNTEPDEEVPFEEPTTHNIYDVAQPAESVNKKAEVKASVEVPDKSTMHIVEEIKESKDVPEITDIGKTNEKAEPIKDPIVPPEISEDVSISDIHTKNKESSINKLNKETACGTPAVDHEISDEARKDEELTTCGKERNEPTKDCTVEVKTNETRGSGEKVLLCEANDMRECVPAVGANFIVEDEVTERETELLKIVPRDIMKRSHLVVENEDNDDGATSKKPRKLYTVLKPPKDDEPDLYTLEITKRIKQQLPPSISVTLKKPTDLESNGDIPKEKNTKSHTTFQGSILEKKLPLPSNHTYVQSATSKSSITDALLPPIAPISIPVTQIPGSPYNSLICTSVASKSSSILNSTDSNKNSIIPAVITTKPKITILNPNPAIPSTIKSVKVIPRNCTVFPMKSSNSSNDNKALITSIKILPPNPALLKVASNADPNKESVATTMLPTTIDNKKDVATTPDNNTGALDYIPTLRREEEQNHIDSDTMPTFTQTYLKSLSEYIREARAYNAATVGKKNENDRNNKVLESVAATSEDIESDLVTYEIFDKGYDDTTCNVNTERRHMSTQTKDSITNILSKIAALKEKTNQQAEDILSLKAAMKLLNSKTEVKKT